MVDCFAIFVLLNSNWGLSGRCTEMQNEKCKGQNGKLGFIALLRVHFVGNDLCVVPLVPIWNLLWRYTAHISVGAGFYSARCPNIVQEPKPQNKKHKIKQKINKTSKINIFLHLRPSCKRWYSGIGIPAKREEQSPSPTRGQLCIAISNARMASTERHTGRSLQSAPAIER